MLPEELRSKYPEVPWASIINVGHRLRHEYHQIDADIIWDTANEHVGALREVVRVMATALDAQPG